MNLLDQISHIRDGATIIADWLGDGGQTVDLETAQRRADVCLKCPKHGPGSPFTEAAALAVKKTLELKNKLNLRVKGEKQLQTCQACNCVMRLKIWMPEGRVQQVTDSESFELMPGNCWVRTEAA